MTKKRVNERTDESVPWWCGHIERIENSSIAKIKWYRRGRVWKEIQWVEREKYG